MIPSLVASEVKTVLPDFLTTRFRPSNAVLAGVIDEFLETPENLLKGPYLSIQLPFEQDAEGGEPFPEIPLGFAPFRHQRKAFERLQDGRSTVIATGTGSGKTECFLLPILEWCRQQHGKRGIKAIVIYPMNALAHDQSRRIAKLIHETDSLKGKVTAGMFVGQAERSPQDSMTADHIVANRRTLLDWPPDILLTNYKMLDYLLSRPRDQRLWRFNKPETLRWLVVDELHTFDGAQGTDLACLIRRLKARLGAQGAQLRCVGTSATLGSADDGNLREYVSKVFGEPFDEDSIVGESRMSIDQLLGEAFLKWHLMPGTDFSRMRAAAGRECTHEYLRTAYETLFGAPLQGSWDAPEARMSLADDLKSHSTFVNLLRALEGRAKSLPEIGERLRASLPTASDTDALAVLNGFCALTAAARLKDEQPFLQVGLHLWVRELRRMVCSVRRPSDSSSDAAALAAESGPQLRFSDEIAADETVIHLPLVQCRECHATAWAAVPNPEGTKVLQDLRLFYNLFFSRDPRVCFLFPSSMPPRAKGQRVQICSGCGALHAGPARKECSQCGSRHPRAELVSTFRPDLKETEQWQGKQRFRLSRTCPYCDAKHALIIFGVRSTPLTSVALAQAFGSPHNDDPKVIAFSDNVQDAAHRAGFYAARTWRNLRRAAIAQVIESNGRVSLAELPRRVVDHWSGPAGDSDGFETARFVSDFLAPDRQWLRDFQELRNRDRLPHGSDLSDLVKRRLEWDTLAEFGYLSNLEASLEQTGVVAVGFDIEAFDSAADWAATQVREQIGDFRELPPRYVRQIALGVMRHMKDRGAFGGEVAKGYLESRGNIWTINREKALPDLGPESPLPVYPSEGVPRERGRHGVEPLTNKSGATWYERWVRHVLAPCKVLWAPHYTPLVLTLVLEGLEQFGLIQRRTKDAGAVWALDPRRFYVTAEGVAWRGRSPGHELIVPKAEAEIWDGVPCLDFSEGASTEDSDADLKATNGVYQAFRAAVPTWLGRQYLYGQIRRVVAEEHTALLGRRDRERIQNRFAARDSKPWDPNLLSATSTLELGIDIGDLSTVVLASVPPAQSNYVQRIGRAGRRDGNAFTFTVAEARSHDQYYYADPDAMLNGTVKPPGVFLNASAVLERQLTAYCLDCWSASGVKEEAVPPKLGTVLNAVEKQSLKVFPYPFFDYVDLEARELLDRFLAAFKGELSDDSQNYLELFLMGELGGSPRLQYRILRVLSRRSEERNAIGKDINRLTSRIKRLEAGPQDEAAVDDVRRAKAERSGLRKLRSELNDRDTFNFLTDEGLIPNYAFPEEGVMLKSVILRASGPPQDRSYSGDGAEVYEFVRPAAAALGELAPLNHFYAGGHHVEVDRVDLHLSEIETWRLCPSCTYCERVDSDDANVHCPRCGDPMWADAGQRRAMLAMRLVHATSLARRSQIIDDREEREPLFYTRHLVADVKPSSVSHAYASSSGGPAFGLEYSAKTTFREINFGRRDAKGAPTKFAGEETPRDGFRICRHCGKVQRGKLYPDHSISCKLHGKHAGVYRGPAFAAEDLDAADDAYVNCLYLYREFSSEAIRVLLPFAALGEKDPRIVSFIAALELGLRLRFEGRVDHLRAMTTSMKDPDSHEVRLFLVIYDTVPGGTGYLKDLLAYELGLVKVLECACEALEQCACARDPLRDGCYQCVYRYSRRTSESQPSRRVALEVLRAILDVAASLEPVEGLDGFGGAGGTQSELESRFLEALRRVTVRDGLGALHQEIVCGRAGYVLRLDSETWMIEPQADLGETDGVAIASRPDFLFRPARPGIGKLSVAVFLDGFTYHGDRVDEDSVKRMSIVRSGILQWSLTWRDLNSTFGRAEDVPDLLRSGGDAAHPVPSPMSAAQSAFDKRLAVGPLRAELRKNSFELFVQYLRRPDAEAWRRAVFVDLLSVFDQDRMITGALQRSFAKGLAETMPPQATEEARDLASPAAVGGRGDWTGVGPSPAELLAAIPLASVNDCNPDELFAAIHLRDASRDREQDGYQRAWNGVLRLFNLLQFLPNAWFTTTRAVEQDRYPRFRTGAEAPEAVDPVSDGAWGEAFELTDPGFRELLSALRDTGVPAPEIGYELASEAGGVIAMAELAWPDSKMACFLEDQEADRQEFEGAGWTVGGSETAPETVQDAVSGQGNTQN